MERCRHQNVLFLPGGVVTQTNFPPLAVVVELIHSSSVCTSGWNSPGAAGPHLFTSLKPKLYFYKIKGGENKICKFYGKKNIPTKVQNWRKSRRICLQSWSANSSYLHSSTSSQTWKDQYRIESFSKLFINKLKRQFLCTCLTWSDIF